MVVAEDEDRELLDRLAIRGVHAGLVEPFAQVDLRRAALQAARQALIAMREGDEIGDDAFRGVERELDLIEMAVGGTE